MAINAVNTIFPSSSGGTSKPSEKVAGADFKDMLFKELEKVEQAQGESSAISNSAITGTAESVHQMKIAGMKAEMTLEFAVAVNNKAIEAYKEVLRVQL